MKTRESLYQKDSNMIRRFNKVKVLFGEISIWVGDQIRIPRVAITFFLFSPSFSKAILRTAQLPSLCNVVSSIYNFLFLISPWPYSCVVIYIIVRINKQRDKSFEFSSILSTVDLSKHSITA